MITIRFVTSTLSLDSVVLLRMSPDWQDRTGHIDGAWVFDVDEQVLPDPLTFKFVLAPDQWMLGGNLVIPDPVDGSERS